MDIDSKKYFEIIYANPQIIDTANLYLTLWERLVFPKNMGISNWEENEVFLYKNS